MDLSIVVPVFNVERFLHKCIKSILKQNGFTYEIILVDDGSTDGSGLICDWYSSMYPNIKTIHKLNGGSTSARSAGIRIANGKYIGFIDSDDWIDSNMYVDFIAFLESHLDVDVCIGCMKRSYQDGREKLIFKKEKASIIDVEKALDEMINMRIYRWEMCDKIYRMDLLRDVVFDDRIRVGEDLSNNWEIFKKVRKVYYNPLNRYHYRFNPDSISVKKRIEDNTMWIVLGKMLTDTYCLKDAYYLNRKILYKYVSTVIAYIGEMFFYNERIYKKNIIEIQDDVRMKLVIYDKSILPEKMRRGIGYVMSSYSYCRKYFINVFTNMEIVIKKTFAVNKIVYIYGTGAVGKYVKFILTRNGLTCCAFIVSDGENKTNEFYGSDVIFLSEVVNKDVVILLAMNQRNQDYIKIKLKKLGYSNVISLDYLI